MNKSWHRGVDRRTAFERLVDSHLEKIQDELMPDKAKMVVAINVETGEYVLGDDFAEASTAYKKRWPNGGFFICRVDGTPALRL